MSNHTSPGFAVGHNMPGCLPDDPEDVHYCKTFEDAKQVLIGELLFRADIAGDEDAEDVAEQLTAAAEDVNLWTGPGDVTIDGMAYWVQDAEVEDDEDDEPIDPDYYHDLRVGNRD